MGEYLLAFFMFRYLRRSLRDTEILPKWDKVLQAGMVISLVLLVLEVVADNINQYTTWLSYPLLLYLAYLIYWKAEFNEKKSVFTAVLPFILVSLFTKITRLVNAEFHQTWEDVFDVAGLFAVIWMVVMLVITNKQNKALAREREKTLQEEKQNKIISQMKADLEVQVVERTAELTRQKEELQRTLDELRTAQEQLIHSEKMASLGELTAGIAHEIQNPLNFVNNFSEVSEELLEEMKEQIRTGNSQDAMEIAEDLGQNLDKINHHGHRASSIVRGMLQHSRSSSDEIQPTDINALVDEYLRLSYHGFRAKDKSFNASITTDLADDLPLLSIVPQEIGRVLLNLINNAFQAVKAVEKPEVVVTTQIEDRKVVITVKDNGPGIPAEIIEKIFQPFFTTKAAGEGTGLGLSLSYDIVTKGHGGQLTVESKEGEGSTFSVKLPQS
jgi:signal transduction histidine kinase